MKFFSRQIAGAPVRGGAPRGATDTPDTLGRRLGARQQSGVTLTELLITLAIGAILLSLATPSFQWIVRTNRTAAVTNEFVRALQLARSEAVTRGVRVTVCKSNTTDQSDPDNIVCNADADWTDGWIVFIDLANEGVRDAPNDEPIMRIGEPPSPSASGLTITASSKFADYISYLPTGLSDGANNLNNGSFRISMASEERRIVINATGRVYTERSAS